MNILLDLNILLDVFELRQPHYAASARVLGSAVEKQFHAFVPGHAPATIHYLAQKSVGRDKANEAIDWILDWLEIVPADADAYRRARELNLKDFEDSVVVALVQVAECDWIVTRNVKDFEKVPVSAVSPEALLELLTSKYE